MLWRADLRGDRVGRRADHAHRAARRAGHVQRAAVRADARGLKEVHAGGPARSAGDRDGRDVRVAGRVDDRDRAGLVVRHIKPGAVGRQQHGVWRAAGRDRGQQRPGAGVDGVDVVAAVAGQVKGRAIRGHGHAERLAAGRRDRVLGQHAGGRVILVDAREGGEVEDRSVRAHGHGAERGAGAVGRRCLLGALERVDAVRRHVRSTYVGGGAVRAHHQAVSGSGVGEACLELLGGGAGRAQGNQGVREAGAGALSEYVDFLLPRARGQRGPRHRGHQGHRGHQRRGQGERDRTAGHPRPLAAGWPRRVAQLQAPP